MRFVRFMYLLTQQASSRRRNLQSRTSGNKLLHKDLLLMDLKPLSGILKSQTWKFVFSKSKIEEPVELELHVDVLVSSIRGSFRFRI